MSADEIGAIDIGMPSPVEEVDRKRIVLFDSSDVVASVGRAGLLEDRASNHVVTRERAVRSDVLAQALEEKPPPADAPASLTDINSSAARDGDTTLVIFSLLNDMIPGPVHQHQASGWLLQVDPSDIDEASQGWLDSQCEPAAELEAEDTAKNLERIFAALQASGQKTVVFNVSTYDPDDQTHHFTAETIDSFSVRANRLIAYLETLAQEFGVSVVDVDGAVAELGAIAHVVKPGEFSAEAADFITEDVELLIDQSGVLGASVQAPVMRIEIPAYDRRTTSGVLASWHVESGNDVRLGDPLFDVRFDGLHYRAGEQAARSREKRAGRKVDRRRDSLRNAIVLEVFAGSDGCFNRPTVQEGERVQVGETAGVVTAEATSAAVPFDGDTPTFRLGMRIKTQ